MSNDPLIKRFFNNINNKEKLEEILKILYKLFINIQKKEIDYNLIL